MFLESRFVVGLGLVFGLGVWEVYVVRISFIWGKICRREDL